MFCSLPINWLGVKKTMPACLQWSVLICARLGLMQLKCSGHDIRATGLSVQ